MEVDATAEGSGRYGGVNDLKLTSQSRCRLSEGDADGDSYSTGHRGWSHSAKKASYLIRLSDDIVLSSVCDSCGGYGECWVQAEGQGWFRCSFCAKYHWPWVESGS